MYKGLICDLDGVVYRGREAVPGAIDALHHAEQLGIRVAFATNNASRPPDEIRNHLSSLGLGRSAALIVTSAMAAAEYVRERYAIGTDVLAIGGPGVGQALSEAELHPVYSIRTNGIPPVVVQGAGPDVSWTHLAEASYAVQSGSLWVATNSDQTIPTSSGLAPGNGTLVSAVAIASRQTPVVVGKPEPHLFATALAHLELSAHQVLVVGDRLDTDVRAATAIGCDSLWVLSGAHTRSDFTGAETDSHPTYVSDDLGGLIQAPIRIT
jgi:HAD superfamily hydrolase (TIGR01450 family)